MLFAISCMDRSDAGNTRAQNRNDHLAYLREHGDQIMAAGPYLTESGDGMIGTLLLMQFPDRDAAEVFAANDPYNRAGLFERVSIRPWKKVLPAE